MKAIRIAAIDIGTSKICTLIGRVDVPSGFRILGVGEIPSQGIEQGLVTDAAAFVRSIRQSVEKAETMAGYRLESAYLNLSGRYLRSINSRGTVAISHRNQTVHQDDVRRAFKIALDSKLSAGQQMLYVVPRAITLDGNIVEEPAGMHGYELNIEIHAVIADNLPLQNLRKYVKEARIKIDGIIPGSWASAEAVLNEEEKQNGVLLADIGSGCTDITVIKNGVPYHTSSLPSGGQWITSEISKNLEISIEAAENTKKKYGSVDQTEVVYDEELNAGKSRSGLSLQALNRIIRSRTEAILHLVMLDLQIVEIPNMDYRNLIPSGLVITGGCANLPNLGDLVPQITRLPVRIGYPELPGGLSGSRLNDPSYATGVGLLIWQIKKQDSFRWSSSRVAPASMRTR